MTDETLYTERCTGCEQAAALINFKSICMLSGHTVLPLSFNILSTPAWNECDYVLACSGCTNFKLQCAMQQKHLDCSQQHECACSSNPTIIHKTDSSHDQTCVGSISHFLDNPPL